MTSVPEPSIVDGLYRSQEEQDLLNLIDSLRTQGLGQFISIPQIIIIGDQSSGKSSTLEAGTGFPFPTADGLCTVFATELRLRRADEVEIIVKIIPAPHRTDAEKVKIEDFGGKRDTFSRDDIGVWIEEAKEVMGISKSNPISDDVLQISVSGPDYPLLTIVDLPGLVHAGKGRESIQAMVNSYMAEPRSVILAVVSGKNDIENQKVLDLVKLYDPDGDRTLGIITKPDIPKEGTKSEKDLVALAKNEHHEFRFRLGWHVLRNRDEKEAGSSEDERDAAERKFFSNAPWRDVPQSCRGRDALKPRLSKVLMNQNRAEFPALVTEVEGKFQDRTTMLEKLGESRATLEEQRTFLIGLSNKFQQVVNDASDGSYRHDFFSQPMSDDDGYERRLRAVIQNLNVKFSEKMRLKGHTCRIVDDDDGVDEEDELDVEDELDESNSEEDEPPRILRKDFCRTVGVNLKRSRGLELPGLPNPLMVRDIFVTQAIPWEKLTRWHLEAAVRAVLRFLVEAVSDSTSTTAKGPPLEDSAVKNDVGKIILREVVSPFMSLRAAKMNRKLDKLLKANRRNPMTYNHYFTETIQKMQTKRLTDRLQEGADEHGDINMVDLIRQISIQNEANMEMIACMGLVDYMEAYYKVALKRFVDNIADQIIEEQLIEPLRDLFSPPAIQRMPPHLISKIAAESIADQCKRRELKRELAILEKCLQTCKAFLAGVPII